MLRCTRCKKLKTFDQMSKQASKKSGFHAQCKKCNSERAAKWNKDNPKKACINSMKWSRANPEIVKTNIKNWQLANKEYCKIVYGPKQKEWVNNNRDKVRAKDARRHAAELKRTPRWLTPLHYQQIQIFYKAAVALTKEFNVKMEVDHIVPLQGKNVSGLPVPWNLQVLTKVDNMKKGNR